LIGNKWNSSGHLAIASIQKLTSKNGTSWKNHIRRKGLPTLTGTFKRKVDADQWIRKQETNLDKHGFHSLVEAKETALSEAIERYINEHPTERLSTLPLTQLNDKPA